MSEIKLTIDGTEYQLALLSENDGINTVTVNYNGEQYVADITPKQPVPNYPVGTKVKEVWGTNIVYTKLESGKWTDGNIHTFVINETQIRDGGRFKLLDKVKPQPLFTTEDGVDLYKRSDIVIGIDRKTGLIKSGNGNSIGTWLNGWYTTDKVPSPKDFNDSDVLSAVNERYALFHSKEKADNYILENKPIGISLKDVFEILNSVADNTTGVNNKSYLREKFKSLFKSKITNEK